MNQNLLLNILSTTEFGNEKMAVGISLVVFANVQIFKQLIRFSLEKFQEIEPTSSK